MRNTITTGKVGEVALAPGTDDSVLDDLEDGTVTGRASMSNVQNPADASVERTAQPEEKHLRSEEQPTSPEMIAPTIEPVIRRHHVHPSHQTERTCSGNNILTSVE